MEHVVVYVVFDGLSVEFELVTRFQSFRNFLFGAQNDIRTGKAAILCWLHFKQHKMMASR